MLTLLISGFVVGCAEKNVVLSNASGHEYPFLAIITYLNGFILDPRLLCSISYASFARKIKP